MQRLVIVALLVAAGCATVKGVRYYTLDMKPTGATPSAVNLSVDYFRVAEALARRNLLIMKKPTQIEYYAVDQWAAGIEEIVAEKLNAEFGPKQDGRKAILVSGTILAFEQVDTPGGVDAYIKLSALFRDGDATRYDTPLLEKTYEIRQPASANNAPSVVLALSECLAKIAHEMVTDAGTL
jgi:ABC-type uncharacterized transport system auxiliary subunit